MIPAYLKFERRSVRKKTHTIGGLSNPLGWVFNSACRVNLPKFVRLMHRPGVGYK